MSSSRSDEGVILTEELLLRSGRHLRMDQLSEESKRRMENFGLRSIAAEEVISSEKPARMDELSEEDKRKMEERELQQVFREACAPIVYDMASYPRCDQCIECEILVGKRPMPTYVRNFP